MPLESRTALMQWVLAYLGPVLFAISIQVALPSKARAAGALDLRCESKEPVRHATHVRVDRAALYLLVRGDQCDRPILLWLHGGPGGAQRPLLRLYNGVLERHFVVAYLDQRGAGLSFDPDAPSEDLTIQQHLRDLNVVVDYLRGGTSGRDVIVVGHSWGSALGLLYARDHADKLAAFVGVAPFVSGIEAQRSQFDFVFGKAAREADAGVLHELREIGIPPFSAEEVLPMQSLVDRYGGYFHNRPSFLFATLKGILNGYVAPWHIPSFIRANELSLRAMHDELLALDLREEVPRVNVPVIFMIGRFDRQLDAQLAKAYFDDLDAPSKQIIQFAQSAHNIPFEEPRRFNRELVEILAALLGGSAESVPSFGFTMLPKNNGLQLNDVPDLPHDLSS